jgi:hypothetical protein
VIDSVGGVFGELHHLIDTRADIGSAVAVTMLTAMTLQTTNSEAVYVGLANVTVNGGGDSGSCSNTAATLSCPVSQTLAAGTTLTFYFKPSTWPRRASATWACSPAATRSPSPAPASQSPGGGSQSATDSLLIPASGAHIYAFIGMLSRDLSHLQRKDHATVWRRPGYILTPLSALSRCRSALIAVALR